jgi:type IV pilus assembly protein PilA
VSEAASGSKVNWKSWLALIALLGVIAAVAIPQYADYTHRAQASETISILGAANVPLAEYFSDKQKWPGRIEEVTGSTSGKYTQSVAITRGAGGTGEIELTGTMRTEGVDRRVRGQSVRLLSGDGGRNWVCKPGTMELKNLPATCRN